MSGKDGTCKKSVGISGERVCKGMCRARAGRGVNSAADCGNFMVSMGE